MDELLLPEECRQHAMTFPPDPSTSSMRRKVHDNVRLVMGHVHNWACYQREFEKDGEHWEQWLTPTVIRWFPQKVQDKIKQDKANKCKSTMFHFAGPAILSVGPVTVIQWGFAIIFPFVVCWVSSCPEGAQPFAHYPFQVWWPFFVVVVVSMLLEWKGLLWILYVLAGYLAPFKIFFGFRVNIGTWLGLMATMSLVTHLDIATNGLFLAKILKTIWHCHTPTTRAVQDIWWLVIEESSVKNIPGFHRIDFILLISWGVMLFQPLLCFLYCYPLKHPWNTNYEVGVGGADRTKGEMNGYKTPWVCCSRDKLHHADVLKMVAVVNRMVSMTDKSLQWSLARSKEELAKKDNIEGWTRAYDILYREFHFNLIRLFLVNLLEKSWMLEAQTTVFAISRCLMPLDSSSRYDGQMVMSLLLSFLTFMKVIYDAVDQHNMVCKMWKTASEHDRISLVELFRPRVGALASIGFGSQLSKEEQEWADLRRNKRKVLRIWLFFFVTFVFLLGFFFHCLAKFVMAFYCEYSLWNIPLSHKPHQDALGCVDVKQFRHLR